MDRGDTSPRVSTAYKYIGIWMKLISFIVIAITIIIKTSCDILLGIIQQHVEGVPAAAEQLHNDGYQVPAESNAGRHAGTTDAAYKTAELGLLRRLRCWKVDATDRGVQGGVQTPSPPPSSAPLAPAAARHLHTHVLIYMA